MAILNEFGHKRTANEFAKELLLRHGERAFVWQDIMPDAYIDQYTEKQTDEVNARIDFQYGRVFAFFNHPKPDYNKEDADDA
jgi:hypothetical protein